MSQKSVVLERKKNGRGHKKKEMTFMLSQKCGLKRISRNGNPYYMARKSWDSMNRNYLTAPMERVYDWRERCKASLELKGKPKKAKSKKS